MSKIKGKKIKAIIKDNLLFGVFNRKKGKKLRIYPSNYQHIGSRAEQEDSFAFNNLADKELIANSGILVVLADGMGGLEKGKEASQAAIDAFLQGYEQNTQGTINQRLTQALTIANSAVFDLALRNGVSYDIGTTLVAVVIYRDNLFWVSAGDSRAYIFRQGKLYQLTKDHVYANNLAEDVAYGLITEKDAENHPHKDHLTSYLGLPQLPEVDQNINPLSLGPGDRIMLCSDGLYNTLDENEMIAVLKTEQDDPALKIIEVALAKNNPYQDNLTVVVLSCC
jgi:PPM family protein phosphatase